MPDIIEQFLQTSLAFFSILIFARLIGKQQLSQLTFYDYINGITIGSIAGALATDEPSRMWQHFFDLLIFSMFTFLITYLVLKNRPLRKLLDGEPTIVIHNGKILEGNMTKIRYNIDDLLMQLREKNVFNINDIEYGIIETDGMLSVLLKSQKRPVNSSDLKIATKYEGLDRSLIIDGELIHKNLQQLNLDEHWLNEKLKARGIPSIEQVGYADLDSEGHLYLDTKVDNVKDKPIG